MNCVSCEAKLADYATARLDASIAAEVTRHVEACASCDEFLTRVRELYGLELEYRPAPPARLDVTPRPSTGASGRRKRITMITAVGVAVAATVLFALIVRHDPASERPEVGGETVELGAQSAPDVVPISIRVELPDLPTAAPDDWIEDREQAQLVADYAGKPILEQYVCDACPTCGELTGLLDEERFAMRLDEFVRCRIVMPEVINELPSVLSARLSPSQANAAFPAMFASDGACSTTPVLMMRTWEDVERVIADYAVDCAGDEEAFTRALDDELFGDTLDTMRALPALVDEQRFGEALEALRSIARLGEKHRTRFASEAQRLEEKLVADLESEFDRAEELRLEGERGRTRARAIGRTLLVGLKGTEFEARAVALCR